MGREPGREPGRERRGQTSELCKVAGGAGRGGQKHRTAVSRLYLPHFAVRVGPHSLPLIPEDTAVSPRFGLTPLMNNSACFNPGQDTADPAPSPRRARTHSHKLSPTHPRPCAKPKIVTSHTAPEGGSAGRDSRVLNPQQPCHHTRTLLAT